MDPVWFWLAAGGMTLAVAATLMAALWRGRTGAVPAASDIGVYRDQLDELERDVARGVVAAEEAERIRTEVARRILEADRAARGAAGIMPTPRAARLAAAGVIVLLLGVGAFVAYGRIGAPGYPDLPLAVRLAEAEARAVARPGQAEAEARFAAARPAAPEPAAEPRHVELMQQLRAVVAARPDDLQGQELLARNEAILGDFAAAHRAQAEVIRLRGAAATAADHAAHAELMILAAGGFVSPEAEAALNRALAADPREPTAHYYMGLMFAQNGRFDLAFRVWRPLLESSPPDAPWVAPIREQIAEVAARAGVDYAPPAPARGPDAAAVEAAADMTPEARATMIRGMVEGLMARLATEGGPPEDWAQLIRALGVLGERERAAAIWAEAQGRFAALPEALAMVREAAAAAGIVP
ncbi:MAG: c-type cytochrome biogenesis protein CcmI [Gemmobacter sp.]